MSRTASVTSAASMVRIPITLKFSSPTEASAVPAQMPRTERMICCVEIWIWVGMPPNRSWVRQDRTLAIVRALGSAFSSLKRMPMANTTTGVKALIGECMRVEKIETTVFVYSKRSCLPFSYLQHLDERHRQVQIGGIA